MNDILASGMAQLASLFHGNLGWAIVALAVTVRLALLPLTLYLARKMYANQKKIKALQPQVEAIKQRLAADPKAMFAAISALYKENGAHMIDRSSLLGALAQWPVFLVMYRAISNASAASQAGASSFLWIRSIATPDVALTGVVLALSALAAYYAPAAADGAVLMMVIQVAVTAFVLWQMSAGIGLYWAASAAVGVVQTAILRYEQRNDTSAARPAQ
jgi:YidC/Oxa1 family membrane protein insertase